VLVGIDKQNKPLRVPIGQERSIPIIHDEVSVKKNEFIDIHSFIDDNKPLCITLQVNNQRLQMKLDTSSALSIISYDEFKDKFRNERLVKSNIILKTYTGEKVSPVGKCNVKVIHNECTFNLDLYVLKSKGPALLGREWLKRLPINLNEFTCADVKDRCMLPETNFVNDLLPNLC